MEAADVTNLWAPHVSMPPTGSSMATPTANTLPRSLETAQLSSAAHPPTLRFVAVILKLYFPTSTATKAAKDVAAMLSMVVPAK